MTFAPLPFVHNQNVCSRAICIYCIGVDATRVEAIATRVEAIATGDGGRYWGWRPSLIGWRQILYYTILYSRCFELCSLSIFTFVAIRTACCRWTVAIFCVRRSTCCSNELTRSFKKLFSSLSIWSWDMGACR